MFLGLLGTKANVWWLRTVTVCITFGDKTVRGANAQHHILHVSANFNYLLVSRQRVPPRGHPLRNPHAPVHPVYTLFLSVCLAAAEVTAVRGHAKRAFKNMTTAEAVILTI